MVDEATLRELGWSDELVAAVQDATVFPVHDPVIGDEPRSLVSIDVAPGAGSELKLAGSVVGTQHLTLRAK